VVSPPVTLVRQEGRSDCGSAALAMVLEHADPATTPVLVRQLIGQREGKKWVEAGQLRDVARERGLDAYLVEGTFADLVSELRQGRPVLVGVQRDVLGTPYPHFVVVVGIDPQDQQILIADPAHGWTQESFVDFSERWEPAHHLALVVMPKREAVSGE
jgi:ABC-type bacteriocin/lantibiotic exporter with double-glycine peptidase domain